MLCTPWHRQGDRSSNRRQLLSKCRALTVLMNCRACSTQQNPAIVVSAAFQRSAPQRGVMEYRPPMLTDFPEPSIADSVGGGTMVFFGTNFGPEDAPLTVHFVRNTSVAYECPVLVRWSPVPHMAWTVFKSAA
jgi:hypothetical protein